MIKAIVFDAGGVLLRGKFEDVASRAAKNLGFEKKRFAWFKAASYDGCLTGKESFEIFLKRVSSERKLGVSFKKLLLAWKKSYLEVMGINQEVMSLVKRLKKKYVVGLVSNLTDLHGRINIKRGLYSSFRPCLLSYRVGVKKPDKKIFEILLGKLKIAPSECIFIDDRKKHLVAPKKLGFVCVHFKNSRQLEREFKKLGVNI